MSRWRRRRALGTALVIATALVSLPTPGSPGASAVTLPAAPIRVMTIGDFETQDARNVVWALAVRARFAAANLRGGLVDGRGRRHRVVVSACNTAFDPQRAASCADRAVRMRVSAVLGLTTADSASVWPKLEAADIPVIGARINSVADATSPVSFPLGCGLPGLFRAMPRLLAQFGARTVGVVMSDYGAATDTLLADVQQGIAGAGVTAGPVAFVPPDTASLADAATSVTQGGSDGVIGFVGDPAPGNLVRELGRARFNGPYVTQAPFGVSPLASDPDVSEGALLVGQFAPVTADVPGMARFRTDMDESPEGASLARTEGAVNNWLAAWVFERVVRRLDHADAPSVLGEMGRLDHLDMGGITPPLTTSRPGGVVPRMFNPTATFSRVSAGTPARELSPGFVDVFDGHRVQ